MIWKDTIKKKKFSYKQKKYPTTAQKKNKKLNRLSAAEREKKEEVRQFVNGLNLKAT